MPSTAPLRDPDLPWMDPDDPLVVEVRMLQREVPAEHWPAGIIRLWARCADESLAIEDRLHCARVAIVVAAMTAGIDPDVALGFLTPATPAAAAGIDPRDEAPHGRKDA